MEFMWKVVEEVIDTRIKIAAQFHSVLHGFCVGRGIGIVIINLKLAQELASVDQDPLFLIFLDLRKAYDNLDRGWLLQMLVGYGAGPKMRGILA